MFKMSCNYLCKPGPKAKGRPTVLQPWKQDETNPELQRTAKTHPVTTPRFDLAFVKMGNFDEIRTYE